MWLALTVHEIMRGNDYATASFTFRHEKKHIF